MSLQVFFNDFLNEKYEKQYCLNLNLFTINNLNLNNLTNQYFLY